MPMSLGGTVASVSSSGGVCVRRWLSSMGMRPVSRSSWQHTRRSWQLGRRWARRQCCCAGVGRCCPAGHLCGQVAALAMSRGSGLLLQAQHGAQGSGSGCLGSAGAYGLSFPCPAGCLRLWKMRMQKRPQPPVKVVSQQGACRPWTGVATARIGICCECRGFE